MRYRNIGSAFLLALCAAFLVVGCGNQSQQQTSKQNKAQGDQQQATESSRNDTRASASEPVPAPEPQVDSQPACMNCGTVIAIEEHDTVRGNTSKEAIAGAVVGAVAGVMTGSSQFSGDEETIAEIAGGIAGAVAGHQIGKRAATDSYFIVAIDMKQGATKKIRVAKTGTLSVGQKVRVESGTIKPR